MLPFPLPSLLVSLTLFFPLWTYSLGSYHPLSPYYAFPLLTLSHLSVVVGNGMVALRFMEKILEKDTHKMYKLVCFGDEQYPAYDRVQVHTR